MPSTRHTPSITLFQYVIIVVGNIAGNQLKRVRSDMGGGLCPDKVLTLDSCSGTVKLLLHKACITVSKHCFSYSQVHIIVCSDGDNA